MPVTTPSPRGVTRVTIDVIPHHLQRYDTCGDYVYDGEGWLQIRVSQTADWREAMTVAVHELVEALLVVQRDISIPAIDDFDVAYLVSNPHDEPGDAPGAPYYDEHQSATVAERLVAHELGLHWPAYEDDIYALSKTYAHDYADHGAYLEPEPDGDTPDVYL